MRDPSTCMHSSTERRFALKNPEDVEEFVDRNWHSIGKGSSKPIRSVWRLVVMEASIWIDTNTASTKPLLVLQQQHLQPDARLVSHAGLHFSHHSIFPRFFVQFHITYDTIGLHTNVGGFTSASSWCWVPLGESTKSATKSDPYRPHTFVHRHLQTTDARPRRSDDFAELRGSIERRRRDLLCL